ncbi:MAG: cobalamin biosynthesis protein [Succinivibrionaceae bacterium]|nr:cobalamin biosynthesis protein [Succinivibrionaceae bacterium]
MLVEVDYSPVLEFFRSRPGVVGTAMLVAMIFPLSGNLCSLLISRIGDRVCTPGMHPSTASMYGVLANLMVLAPVGALLWCMSVLYDEALPVYDYLLLLFSLEYASIRSSARDVSFRLRNGELKQARRGARNLLLRDTDSMSEMGIAKAVAESVVLRFLQGYFVPVFWYLLLGATAAAVSSILIIMSRSFSVKLPKYEHFGRLNANLGSFASAAPGILMALLLLLTTFDLKSLSRAAGAMKFHPNRVSGLLIAFAAFHFDISLGGPRIYQGRKIRYNRIGGGTDPAAVHVDLCYKMVRNTALLFTAGLIVFQILRLVYLHKTMH